MPHLSINMMSPSERSCCFYKESEHVAPKDKKQKNNHCITCVFLSKVWYIKKIYSCGGQPLHPPPHPKHTVNEIKIS